MRAVVEKELLHCDMLFAMDSAGLLDELTFQGGTCLRLCYGAPRYSEDLDFVAGCDFSTARLKEMKACLTGYIGTRYGLEVIVTEPHELAHEPEYRGLRVDKWRLTVVTAPGDRHVPRQKIKVEVANVPAHTREARDLTPRYDFLPDGYGDIIVLAESLDEILADKLVSLVDCQAYIRHRDIWDLRWLMRRGARPKAELLSAKIRDYEVTGYASKAAAMIERLPTVVQGKPFLDQMTRFLPWDVLETTLHKEKFRVVLVREVAGLLENVVGMISGSR